MKNYTKVLTIAGSDSGGGAGIQADIKTISACGCYASSAITAITAQNTLGVEAIHAVPQKIIQKQIKVVLDDIGTDSVKIGMLLNKQTVMSVRKALKPYSIQDIILDPVMVSTSGSRLLELDSIESMIKYLFPISKIITPNIPEAELLMDKKIKSQDDLPEFAKQMAKMFNVSIYLKAGHLTNKKYFDVFYDISEDEFTFLYGERIKTKNTHGTGCSLSSAIASFKAKKMSNKEAVTNAHQFIQNAILNGKDYNIGNGHGPVHHFYSFWK